MNCYVSNPRDGSQYPSELNKENTLFYPEAGMTFHDQCHSSRPRDFHIVTDSPFLVGLYDRKEVFIWKGGKWVNPEIQTYGASFNLIIDVIFGITSSIARATLDGKTTNCMGYRE